MQISQKSDPKREEQQTLSEANLTFYSEMACDGYNEDCITLPTDIFYTALYRYKHSMTTIANESDETINITEDENNKVSFFDKNHITYGSSFSTIQDS